MSSNSKTKTENFLSLLYSPLAGWLALNPFEYKDLQRQDVSQLKSLVILAGPYRNLTTLTASFLSLHPQIQTLNHAGVLILPRPDLDFFRSDNPKTFDKFCRFALSFSQRGRRGAIGGSILLSHAFDQPIVREKYKQRFGDVRLKPEVLCIAWKESLRVTNHIRKHRIDLDAIFKKNEHVRFLMPIRHPIDCAVSNITKGYQGYFPNNTPNRSDGGDIDLRRMISYIIKEYRWFIEWKTRFPDRFFNFFQYDFTEETVRKIADFLQVDSDPQWIRDTLDIYRIKESYPIEEKIRQYYLEKLSIYLDDYPEFKSQLEKFVL